MSLDVLPVVSVTLTEDRGTVTRRGTVAWSGGPRVVVLRGLSPLLVDDSVQVDVTHPQADVARWSVERRWRQPAQSKSETAQEGIHEVLDGLEVQTWQTRSRVERASQRVGLAAHGLRQYSDAVEGISLRGAAPPDTVQSGLQHGVERVISSVHQLFDALDDADTLGRELHLMSGADDGQRGEPTLEAELHIHLDGTAPASQELLVEVRYLLPSALWRPSYEAELIEANGQDGGSELVLRLVAAAWQRTGEHWDDVELVLSTARPSASSALPELHHDVLHAREKSRAEARQIDASFRDQAIDSASLTDGTTEQVLPGVDDGGEVRVFRPARRLSLPSDGRARRVVVGELRAPAETIRKTVPARLPAVIHAATARNTLQLPGTGPVPLMAGPVLLVRGDGTCVGTGKLPYVAPGERFELGFGSEDDLLVTHRHGRRTESRFARSDRVWFTSITTLTSMSGEAVDLEVYDRVPVSELSEVTIEVAPGPEEGPPRQGPDEEGHVQWTVRLKPGQRLKLEVAFAIEKPDRVTLPDPW